MNSRTDIQVDELEQYQNLESAGQSSWVARLRSLDRVRFLHFGTILAYMATITVLYLGWINRAELPITAEEGTGYWLGIIGGSMMLALLLYPLRKKSRFLRKLGKVKYWFQMHMIFGVIGPVLVIFHSDFSIGSLNSAVALFCMLLVAGSGLIGRYFYARIHYGLYGRIATLKTLREDDNLIHEQLEKLLAFSPELLQKMDAMVDVIMTTDPRADKQLSRSLLSGFRAHHIHYVVLRAVRKALREEAKNKGWRPAVSKTIYKAVREKLGLHLSIVRRIAQLKFYERLFSLWHILHFPLFLMLVISGIVHVLAVHAY